MDMKRDQVDNQMGIISQLYHPSGLSTPDSPTQQGKQSSKRKMRTKKAKKPDDCLTLIATSSNNSEEEGSVISVNKFLKRKLSEEQVKFLEMSFGCEHKLESGRKDRLASELGLNPRQVAVWFQNRRARWKNKKLQEEYSKLKSQHDQVVLEKCHLESELLRMREQLAGAQREVERLSSSTSNNNDHTCNNSPSSSMTTMDVMQPPQLQGAADHCYNPFGCFDGVFYFPEEDGCMMVPRMGIMEWPNFYNI